MKRILSVVLAVCCLAACTGDESEAASSGQVWPWEYRAKLAADLEAHRAALAQPWPVEASHSTCTGDCFIGVMVAGSLYAVNGPVSLTSADLGDVVATFDGFDIRAIKGLDPALYLAMDSADGLQLLEYWSVPWEPTSRDLAIQVKEARCAVTTISPRDEVFTGICNEPTIVWYDTNWTPPWLTADSGLRVGEPSVVHVELAEESVNKSEATGTATSFVAQTDSGRIPVETYPSLEAALADVLGDACPTGTPCRAGYRIGTATATEASVTLTTQRADPASENGILVGYASLVVSQARPTVWWVSAQGPHGGYDDADGSATRRQADQLFATCCEQTSGAL